MAAMAKRKHSSGEGGGGHETAGMRMMSLRAKETIVAPKEPPTISTNAGMLTNAERCVPSNSAVANKAPMPSTNPTTVAMSITPSPLSQH